MKHTLEPQQDAEVLTDNFASQTKNISTMKKSGITKSTLTSALKEANLTELPAKWDGSSIFDLCIVKKQTASGEAYVMGKYDADKPYKHRVLRSFFASAYKSSTADEIYPYSGLQNTINEGVATKATPTISDEALKAVQLPILSGLQAKKEWLLENGSKNVHLITSEETADKRIKDICAKQQGLI